MSRHPRCSAVDGRLQLLLCRLLSGRYVDDRVCLWVSLWQVRAHKRGNLPCHRQPRDSATNASKNLKLGRRKFRASSTGRVKLIGQCLRMLAACRVAVRFQRLKIVYSNPKYISYLIFISTTGSNRFSRDAFSHDAERQPRGTASCMRATLDLSP